MSSTFGFVVAALLATTPALLSAQHKPVSSPQPTAAALTALVDSVVKASLLAQGVPGVSVAVVRGDETLVLRAWGRADVATGRAADPSTHFALGSNSKQFTAALVLRLVDRGRLTPGDSIGSHLSGLRPEWREITIEQLLNHTSGLQRSYLPSDRMEEDLPADSLMAQAARDTMFARPGTKYIYSNVGYLLLRVLIEKLYGEPYAAALRDGSRGHSGSPRSGPAEMSRRVPWPPATCALPRGLSRRRPPSIQRRSSGRAASARMPPTSRSGTARSTADGCSPRPPTGQ